MDDASRLELPSVPLASFARSHGLELTRFAYLICGDRALAEDMVQEALLAMYRRFGDLITVDRPVSYARRVIINVNIDWQRRPRPEVLGEILPESPITDPASEPPDSRLWLLLQGLPYKQRVVLVLRYHIGCPDEEIARHLGCRESSVRSLSTRALAALRPRLLADSGGR